MSGSFLRPSLCASSNAHPSIHPPTPLRLANQATTSAQVLLFLRILRTSGRTPLRLRADLPIPLPFPPSAAVCLCDILGRLSRARIAAIVTDEEDRGGPMVAGKRTQKKERKQQQQQPTNKQTNKQTDRQINERRGALLFVGGARARPTRVARGSPLASSAFLHACMNGRVIDARYARDGNFSKDRGGNSRRRTSLPPRVAWMKTKTKKEEEEEEKSVDGRRAR